MKLFFDGKKLKKYFYEFFVIFLGVYLAFVFSDLQEKIQHKEIRIKYYDSLIQEFEVLKYHLKEQRKQLAPFREISSAVENQQTPPLEPVYINYLYHGMVVKAAFYSQNFESLDLESIQSIIRGSIGLEALKKNIEQFNHLQTYLLLPAIENQANFYDKDGKLRKEYQWYLKIGNKILETNLHLDEVVTSQAIPWIKREKQKLLETHFWDL